MKHEKWIIEGVWNDRKLKHLDFIYNVKDVIVVIFHTVAKYSMENKLGTINLHQINWFEDVKTR